MESFKDILQLLAAVYTNIVLFITLYYLIISFFGIIKKRNKKRNFKNNKFALLIAAHNEEAVIHDSIESLKNINYPKELYDIYVIADNCTDNTAEIAKNAGVYVYERFNTEKKGKGYALEWMFKKIFNMETNYDAIGVFDADNLISKNFLIEMNAKLGDGYKVVQGYLDSKNPYDTWITSAYSLSFWGSNRMIQLSRSNLGLSSQLGGTGFCIQTDCLKKLGWGATCLTEDLEFTCKLVLNGEKVAWAHDAIIYDEKPLTLSQSWSQRKRWMQGFADVSGRYFLKLMKRAFTKFDFVAFDCALYSIQPIIIILLSIAMIINTINQFITAPEMFVSTINSIKNANLSFTKLVIMIVGLLQFIYMPFVISLDNKMSLKALGNYIILPIFTITWLPIAIQGILNKNNKEWSHTKHTRSIKINELEKQSS